MRSAPADKLGHSRKAGSNERYLDKIIEEVRALPPEGQQQLRELLDHEARTAELRRIQGKYAHLTTSINAFAARKAEEVARGDRPR
jgi:hypothetical protein